MVASLRELCGVPAPLVTIRSLWGAMTDVHGVDAAVDWPPDLFALADRALEASEAYRFLVSPPPGVERWAQEMSGEAASVARAWWEWLDGTRDDLPRTIVTAWNVVQDGLDIGIDELSAGSAWPVAEALLLLHAIADEACAGLGTATAVPPGPGCGFRAAARELLAESGSLSRLSPGILRVLPRCRTSPSGISIHSLSRHVCVRGPQVDVEWHRMLSRPAYVAAPDSHANVLLLPWPLRVRTRDFRPARYGLPGMDTAQFGFFEFDPSEPFDLDLVDRVLRAAEDEASAVDVVVLPESAITPDDVAPLEDLLGRHGVFLLITGIRSLPDADGGLGTNWVHVGVRQEMVWRHAVQHKHHRWCLDGRQIRQYHLGGALTETKRWWEAVSVPRRSLQIIDEGALTIAPMVCEDLARLEPVADLVRSIGPTLVVTLLLDGPQLSSRWTARYASVLADDPGSSVLTLTSYGMVRRCRPPGCTPSDVVALWKDATGSLTEIAMSDGAHGVLITTNVTSGDSYTADGRYHRGTTDTITLTAVQPLRAAAPSGEGARSTTGPGGADDGAGFPTLDEREVSKATSWAEALAEAAVGEPGAIEAVLRQAVAAEWRVPLGLRPPSRLFRESVDFVRRALKPPGGLDELVAAVACGRRSGDPTAVVTASLIAMALEERLAAEVRCGRRTPEVFRCLEAARLGEAPCAPSGATAG